MDYISKIFETFSVHDDEVAWWIDSGATTHLCKDCGWFMKCEKVQDGSVFHIENV